MGSLANYATNGARSRGARVSLPAMSNDSARAPFFPRLSGLHRADPAGARRTGGGLPLRPELLALFPGGVRSAWRGAGGVAGDEADRAVSSMGRVWIGSSADA